MKRSQKIILQELLYKLINFVINDFSVLTALVIPGNNFRFINSQDEIRDVALNYLIRLSLVRSFVIKNPYILDWIDITPNQNFVEYCKFNKIDHKKVMAKAKEQFLDKGLLEIFQYTFF